MMNLTIITYISMHISRDPLYPNYVGLILVSVHLCYLVFLGESKAYFVSFLGESKTYFVSGIISYLQYVCFGKSPFVTLSVSHISESELGLWMAPFILKYARSPSLF